MLYFVRYEDDNPVAVASGPAKARVGFRAVGFVEVDKKTYDDANAAIAEEEGWLYSEDEPY